MHLFKVLAAHKKMTLREMAKKSGVSEQSLYNAIHNDKPLDSFKLGTLKKIALSLDMDVTEMIKGL